MMARFGFCRLSHQERFVMNKATFLTVFYSDRDLRKTCIIRCLNEDGPSNDLCFLAAAHSYSEAPHKAVAWAIQSVFCNNVSPYRITPFVKGTPSAKSFRMQIQFLAVDMEESQMATQRIQLASATGSAFGSFKATLMSAHKRFTGKRTRQANRDLFEGLAWEVSQGGTPLDAWILSHSGEGLVASSKKHADYLAGLRLALKRGAGGQFPDLACFEPQVVVG